MDVLDEYDPPDNLTETVLDTVDESTRSTLSHLREQLPWARREV